MTTGINRRIALPLLAAALVVGLSGCVEDETIILPQQTQAERAFRRYVAMGNSITAGFMSGGINANTQQQAYPVLLAARAGVPFGVPALAMPGCPAPLLGAVDTDSLGNVVLEEDRLGGPAAPPCALRALPVPDVVQNVAVPGAKMADALDIDRPGNSTSTLTTLINGGMSQVDAMRRARPTFVTSWLGNNDVLNAALFGDTALLTPVDTFEFYHTRVASGIASSGAQGAAIIGILDVTLAPLLQPGLYYWLADSLGVAPKPADANCGPTNEDGSLNPMSMNTVSWLAFSDDSVDVISCDPDAPYVLTGGERVVIDERIIELNDILETEAQVRGWAYLSSTSVLEGQLTGSARHDRLRRCEQLVNTASPEVQVATFNAQCPNANAPNYFGSLVTYDGVHLSASAHAIVATALAAAINNTYEDLDL